MPTNLVLMLSVLAATRAMMLEDFLGGCSSHKSPGYLPTPSYASQCCFVFYVQVLEMPEYSGDHGRAKLNVAELCWQIHGSHSSLCSLQHTHLLPTKESDILRLMLFRSFALRDKISQVLFFLRGGENNCNQCIDSHIENIFTEINW